MTLKAGCCFPASAFYAYVGIIPILALFVIYISYKVYGYYSNILTMESRLLDRKVKKLMAKIGKSSNSDADKAPIPVPLDPLLNTDSTNKAHMRDKIPIHLVHPGSGPGSDPLPDAAPAAPAAAAAGPTAVPAPSGGLGAHSEVALSPRTPVKDPVTNDEVTEMSGYSSQQISSDQVNVSPQGATPKLPDMSELPSISTVEPTSEAASITPSLATPTSMTTSTGVTNPTTSIPPVKKKEERVDTIRLLDDSVYGLKTEVHSPEGNTKSDYSTIDPFQTNAVPPQKPKKQKHRLPQSNLQPTPSDPDTTHTVTSRRTTPPTARLEDVAVYTPPDHSPVAASIRTDPVPAPAPARAVPKQEPAPIQRAQRSYQRFPDPAPTDPIFTPPQEPAAIPERRERDLFDLPPPTHPSPFERNDRQYAKPSGYFAQRARAWLADNRDSDSAEEK